MDTASFDNQSSIVKDDLVARLRRGDRVAMAAAYFSIYGFRELERQLKSVKAFRFIYTSQTFLAAKEAKERREFYIPRLARERGLYGTEFEVKLRNELTQRAIARECADWIRKKAQFRSFAGEQQMPSFLEVESDGDSCVYMPFDQGLTATGLGTKPGDAAYTMVNRMGAPASAAYLQMFDRAWESGQLEDVTAQVIDSIESVYRENAPETIYYLALYNIFSEFLDDANQDALPNDGTGWRDSKIWSSLYDFQRDAAVSIINKLETYNGCILADSVGLGKTYTALAVIKYYESRNRNVLVLCPKKLKDNWLTYRGNVINNPIPEDRLRYDVLYHTDLSRTRGDTATGLPIERINWGNYDLVVIDESHNFRNGAAGSVKRAGGENRYTKLLKKIVRPGVETKVLMLSATPVNNRFNDLKNQLALAYDGREEEWARDLGLGNDIDSVFRQAQTAFGKWEEFPADQRTTKQLMDMLPYDFFRLLDQVTVARSRRHIQRHYDMAALGSFPERNKPLSIRSKLSLADNSITYHEIYESLLDLELAVYMPSRYLLASCREKYAKDDKREGLTVDGREAGIRKLMCVNLLKRLESSVHSFALTLDKVRNLCAHAMSKVDEFVESGRSEAFCDSAGFDLDPDDEAEPVFEVGGETKYDIRDLDYITWRRDLKADLGILDLLLSMVRDITPDRDAKLEDLMSLLKNKVAHPLNPGNRKAVVFTAFADTAEYLFANVSPMLKRELGLDSCLITGNAAPACTLAKPERDMNTLLTLFSPRSKDRDVILPGEDRTIDVLFATDCISEGQNLQDCDFLINYDIHWNPVRIVQRFGRIDRIGSLNTSIQLVNFWPDVELDEYISLKARVEERMRVTVMTSTGDDDLLNEDEKGDLEYRERQLRQMMNEAIDLEDVSGGVSITDLGLGDFRMDLIEYHKANPQIDSLPHGMHAVVTGGEPGVIFVLRNVQPDVGVRSKNQIHPFYLVYVRKDGGVAFGHLEPKEVLDEMRLLCRGKAEPDAELCAAFNRETRDGRDMCETSELLGDAIASIIDAKEGSDVDSFFADGTTGFLEGDVAGLDDFELICFLVVR